MDSILKNFRNPWEKDNWVLQTDVLNTNVLETNVLETNVLEDNITKDNNILLEDPKETTEDAINSFKPLAVNKPKIMKANALGKIIGSWHSEYMSNKVYKGIYYELKYSKLWYRPEVWLDYKRVGGIFLDERLKRNGSDKKPYGIGVFTKYTSTISTSKDVLFEEVLHAALHRHYKIIKPRTVNLLYEETAVRVVQAYAGVYHPREYTDYYMKGFMTNQAVKDYFKVLDEGKDLGSIETDLKKKYITALEKLKKTVYRQYISAGHGSAKNNKLSSVTANNIELFLDFIVKLAND